MLSECATQTCVQEDVAPYTQRTAPWDLLAVD